MLQKLDTFILFVDIIFSRIFEPDMGWEQGDTLATTMLNIFINSVLHNVWDRHPSVPIPATPGSRAGKLVALMYADDLGLADSSDSLQADHTLSQCGSSRLA